MSKRPEACGSCAVPCLLDSATQSLFLNRVRQSMLHACAIVPQGLCMFMSSLRMPRPSHLDQLRRDGAQARRRALRRGPPQQLLELEAQQLRARVGREQRGQARERGAAGRALPSVEREVQHSVGVQVEEADERLDLLHLDRELCAGGQLTDQRGGLQEAQGARLSCVSDSSERNHGCRYSTLFQQGKRQTEVCRTGPSPDSMGLCKGP